MILIGAVLGEWKKVRSAKCEVQNGYFVLVTSYFVLYSNVISGYFFTCSRTVSSTSFNFSLLLASIHIEMHGLVLLWRMPAHAPSPKSIRAPSSVFTG